MTNFGRWAGLALLGAAAMGMGGCSGDKAGASGDVIARVQSQIQTGVVNAVNGTYTGCVNRTGAWSLDVAASGYTLPNSALSVVLNDSTCALSITEMVVDGELFTATPALDLGATFAGSPSSFASATRTFSANAMRTVPDFSANFDVILVHSGDPTESDAGTRVAEYATVETSTVTSSVPASNATLDLATQTPIHYTVNAQQTVLAASGTAALVHGSSSANSYAIDMGTLSSGASYDDVVAAYTALDSASKTHALNPTDDITLNASDFELTGKTLSSPLVRTVILTRVVGGVTGYQLLRVTFSGGPQ